MSELPQFHREWFVPLSPIGTLVRQMIYAEAMRRIASDPAWKVPDDPFDVTAWTTDS